MIHILEDLTHKIEGHPPPPKKKRGSFGFQDIESITKGSRA